MFLLNKCADFGFKLFLVLVKNDEINNQGYQKSKQENTKHKKHVATHSWKCAVHNDFRFSQKNIGAGASVFAGNKKILCFYMKGVLWKLAFNISFELLKRDLVFWNFDFHRCRVWSKIRNKYV